MKEQAITENMKFVTKNRAITAVTVVVVAACLLFAYLTIN